MVSFPDAVKMFFSRYVDFQGRSRRSEYWWVVLFNLIVFGVLAALAFGLGGNFETGEMNPIGMIFFALMGLYGLAVIIPSIALFIRRLHDINQTGWIYLGLVVAGFIPFINFLASIAQIVIACIPGTVGPNKYGPDPKNPGAMAADTFV
jgi:uncharacterized membrane protein YhaH (DUF805 family)